MKTQTVLLSLVLIAGPAFATPANQDFQINVEKALQDADGLAQAGKPYVDAALPYGEVAWEKSAIIAKAAYYGSLLLDLQAAREVRNLSPSQKFDSTNAWQVGAVASLSGITLINASILASIYFAPRKSLAVSVKPAIDSLKKVSAELEGDANLAAKLEKLPYDLALSSGGIEGGARGEAIAPEQARQELKAMRKIRLSSIAKLPFKVAYAPIKIMLRAPVTGAINAASLYLVGYEALVNSQFLMSSEELDSAIELSRQEYEKYVNVIGNWKL